MNKHKRYLLFTWDDYYPRGGMNDLLCSCDTLEEVKDELKEADYNDYEVYDREEGIITKTIIS